MHVLISDDCEVEILDGDSEVLTTPPCKQFKSVPLFFKNGKFSGRNKSVFQVALMIKQTREHKMPGDYSK
jgi:hypothetical protein